MKQEQETASSFFLLFYFSFILALRPQIISGLK